MDLNQLDENQDLIVIGGGVTGAGILCEAARAGARVLLVEQKDFAWGTSSRSSKMIHGGLRYLKQGRIFLTRDSIIHRERLIAEAPGLVEPVDFLMPVYSDAGTGRYTLGAGLFLYDFIAGRKYHEYLKPDELLKIAPYLRQDMLRGGFRLMDAMVDDARLVLRLIFRGCESGGSALSYARAEKIIRDTDGMVKGVEIRDTETGQTRMLQTRVVINATGAWAEELHPSPVRGSHLRPLRGSHLIFPADVIPVEKCMIVPHPEDERPVMVLPWEGAVLVGTTDVDHREDLSLEPSITHEELVYLMKMLEHYFSGMKIAVSDIISTIAGVRSVLSHGNKAPSKESREHVIWKDRGLVTVTGGKLTTFRSMAWDALSSAMGTKKFKSRSLRDEPVFPAVDIPEEYKSRLPAKSLERLYGRYGQRADEIMNAASGNDLEPIEGTDTVWAELPFNARTGRIRHLSDLLLRRVRIGLLLPGGGEKHLDRIEAMCSPFLDWDADRWASEKNAYVDEWKTSHGLPG